MQFTEKMSSLKREVERLEGEAFDIKFRVARSQGQIIDVSEGRDAVVFGPFERDPLLSRVYQLENLAKVYLKDLAFEGRKVAALARRGPNYNDPWGDGPKLAPVDEDTLIKEGRILMTRRFPSYDDSSLFGEEEGEEEEKEEAEEEEEEEKEEKEEKEEEKEEEEEPKKKKKFK